MPKDVPDYSRVSILQLGTAASLTSPGSATPGTIILPPGTVCLEIATTVATSDNGILTLTGATTGQPYYNEQRFQSIVEYAEVNSQNDGSLTYTISHGLGGGVTWRITPLGAYPPNVMSRASSPWQSMMAVATLNNVNVGANSTHSLIGAALTGQDTYLGFCSFQVPAATVGMDLEGATSGTVIASGMSGSGTFQGLGILCDFGGARVGDLTGHPGEAIVFRNQSAGAIGFFGHILYRHAL